MASVISAGVREAKRGDGGGVVLDLAVSCMIGGGEVGDGRGVSAPAPAPDPALAAPLGLPACRFGLSLVAWRVVMGVCWWLVSVNNYR